MPTQALRAGWVRAGTRRTQTSNPTPHRPRAAAAPQAAGGAVPQPPRGPRPPAAPPPPLIGGARGGPARHWLLSQRSRSPLAAAGCHSGRRRQREVVKQTGPSSAGGGGTGPTGPTGTMVSYSGPPALPGAARFAGHRARGGREAESIWEAGSRTTALCFGERWVMFRWGRFPPG